MTARSGSLDDRIARAAEPAFAGSMDEFLAVTLRAKSRFENQQLHARGS